MSNPEPSSSGIVVWIIEDCVSLRKTMVEVLNQTRDLSCALDVGSMEQVGNLEQENGLKPPDVVIVDLGLPGIGGLKGIPLIKQQYPSCEILVFTVSEDRNKIAQSIRLGASGYLLKTERLDRIPSAIREAAAGGGPLSPIAGKVLVESVQSTVLPQHNYGLSRREIEVLELMTAGLGKKEVADRLELSYHTIDTYVRSFYKKLNVNSIHGAVGKALKERLIEA